MSVRQQRGEGALKAVISIVVLIVVVIAGAKIVPVHIRGNELWDTMQEQANFGGVRAPEKLQDAIFNKSQELGIPIQRNEISVTSRGQNIVVSAKYTQTVDVFGYKYVYNFDRTSEKPIF